jgi:uncharacterized protein
MIKRFIAILSLLISFCASAQIDKIVPTKPALSESLVHDFAGILSNEEEKSLESKLESYDLSTSNQVVIVTLPTLKDGNGTAYSDQEVALKILREWGVGQKDKNNGIVVLIVKSSDGKEKKIRIEVGYGLEGVVPDITASQIIDNSIAPNFKAGKYYAGLDAGVDDIIKAAEGKYTAPAGYGSRKKKGGYKTWMILAVLAFVILSGMFGGGGRGGTYVSRGGYTGWTGGGGSGWSGGGGGGGGGFGGFGGGGGGGGGASGSW